MAGPKGLLRPAGIVVGGLVLALVLLRAEARDWAQGGEGPQSLAEVARLAAQRGLHVCSGDRPDGSFHQRLVVSDRPLTWERANSLVFHRPNHPCWVGTVEVCFPLRKFLDNYDPEQAVLWGQTLLIGDPSIIRQLTGRQ